jgi:hypothetical protein
LSREAELELSFKAPDDVKLPEVALLTKSISRLYNKLEHFTATRRRLSAETDDDNRKPEEKLVIKEIRYGSDLVLILLTAANTALLIPDFIIAARKMREREQQRIAHERMQNKDVAEMSFGRLLKGEEGDKLRQSVSKLADQLDIDVDKLLELVGPELEIIYDSKIKFRTRDLPYQ